MAEITRPTTSTAIVDRYLAVWSEPEPTARREAIASLWAPDGVEFVDGKQFHGHEELQMRVAEAYEQFVGSGLYTVASAADATTHGNIVMFTIRLVSRNDETAWAARVFLVLDEDGLISQDYHVTVQTLGAQ